MKRKKFYFLPQSAQRTPGPNRLLTNHIKPTNVCILPSFPTDLNDPQILKESPFLFEKRKNLFEN